MLALMMGILLMTAASLPATAQEQEVILLTHPAQQAATSDQKFLRLAYMQRVRRWPDGTPVVLFTLPDETDAHRAFCAKWLGIYPYVLRSIWDRQAFTGVGKSPRLVGDLAAMRKAVAATPGAIGYDIGQADASVPANPLATGAEKP